MLEATLGLRSVCMSSALGPARLSSIVRRLYSMELQSPMATYSTKMLMSLSTLGTGTSSRGGYCCRRESRVLSSAARAMSHFESWGAEVRFHLAARSRQARVGCHFVRSFMLQASACFGGHLSRRSAAVSAARSPSPGSVAIVRLHFHSSALALAALTGSGAHIMQDETRKFDYDGEVRFVRFRRAA